MQQFKVMRLKTDCCGMKANHIYPAMSDYEKSNYVRCQLPDGSWTTDHFAAFNTDSPWFEVVL